MPELIFTMVVPLTLCGVALYGTARRVDVYGALVQGAGSGLETLVRIIPSLVGLMTAVYMLRASGALDLEDAADSRVYEWGLLAFAAGVRLGLGLCVGLEELEPEELL